MNAQPTPKFGAVRVLGQLISRLGLSTALGQRFDGLRDYYAVFGYKTTLTYDDMLAKYSRQGIASRIVDAPAQALWDNPPVVSSNNKAWNDAWDRLIVKNSLWNTILKLDKLCGLGCYSCLYIGTNSGQNPEDVVRVPNNGKLTEIVYFQPYSQNSADIANLVGDVRSAQYMLPEYYLMYPFRKMETGVGAVMKGAPLVPSFKAHYSRILHVAENTLENSVFGMPRLERVFNDLDDIMKVSGGTAETFWLTSNRGMQVDVDKDMDLNEEDAAQLTDEIDEYMHQLRRFIRTRGVKVNNLGSETPNPMQTFDVLIALISGATGIPRRILTGAEAGQLASEQDRANWAERIVARRKEFGEPIVIFPLISQLTQLGVLPNDASLKITVDWPDAYQLSPLELAQKSAQHARSATNFARALEIMHNLEQGTPGTPGTPGTKDITNTDGSVTKGSPGTPEIPGIPGLPGATDMITIPEIRDFLELNKIAPQINDPGDLSGQKL